MTVPAHGTALITVLFRADPAACRGHGLARNTYAVDSVPVRTTVLGYIGGTQPLSLGETMQYDSPSRADCRA